MARLKEVRDPKRLEREWENGSRWNGIVRDYTADDVERLRGSIDIKYTLAEMGADRLLRLLNEEPYVAARSEEQTSELQSRRDLVCRLLLAIKNILSRVMAERIAR